MNNAKPASAKSFFSLMKSLKWPIGAVVVAIVLTLIDTVMGLIIPLVTANLVDTLTTALFQWKTAGLLLIVFVLQAAAGGFSYYLLSYIGESIVKDLRNRLWSKVLRLPVPYYDAHETGETMSRLTQDTSALKELIKNHLVTFVSGIISVIGSVIILSFIDWRMTLILLISVPVSMAIIIPLGKIMSKIARSTQAEMASFSGLLGRVLADIRLVKSYRAEDAEGNKGEKAIASLFGFGLKEAKVQALISPIMTLIMMGILVVILGYGGLQVSSGALTAGELVAIIFYLFQIVMPFAQMASFFTSFQKAAGATERIQEILQMENEQHEGIQLSKEGGLSFENVTFSYNAEKTILYNLSFHAEVGTVTALVGPSGGGKTTIFSLIERFYQPDSGTIQFGGQSIQDIALNSWRKRIGYVSQESPLMSGSIADNIAYGLEEVPSLEQMKAAAEAANALDFIEQLPDGFETLVGERGMKLSGGQRQRIAIARALLHNPEILLLDEATSNLDSGSEAHVQEALNRLMQGRTTLIIAHRLATITHADQIIMIEGGKVTGKGTHVELLANHPLYREFAEGQGLN